MEKEKAIELTIIRILVLLGSRWKQTIKPHFFEQSSRWLEENREFAPVRTSGNVP